jgi:murein L,D-transpeptidase YcbB/YkuD
MAKFSSGRVLKVTTSALAAFMLIGAPDASAQNLFERLFGGNRIRHYEEFPREPVREAPRQQQQQQRVSAPRIAGPSFYDYKTDALVRVDFAALSLALAKADADHAMALPDRSIVTASAEAAPVILASSVQQPAAPRIVLPAPRGRSAAAAPRGAVDPAFATDEARAREAEEAKATAANGRLSTDALEALAEFELMTEKGVAEALVAHYADNPDFIWVDDGRPNAQARDALRVLGAADSHALDPAHYFVAVPVGTSPSADALARFEMQLSARVLRYVRDVHGGRINPNRISGYHDFELKEVDFGAALTQLASADDVRGWLDEQHPQNRFYRALRAELQELRAAEENSIVIAEGTFIRPGQTNAEFAKILKLIAKEADAGFMAEHGATLAANEGAIVYSDALVPVIRASQAANGLQVDGIIGPRTVSAIAGESKAARVTKVELALEQLRWLPSALSDRYVFLNAPSFMATYFENGEERLSMRAIYGKPSTQTYHFKDRVSYVEFHPYWGMPRSILVNTYLSRVYSDPGYFDRNGYEVTDQRGRRVSSSSVNWGAYGANIPFNVRQLPGPRNALGELKIMFPNKHAIYMHDTPDRDLFARENRAISNGCVRLEDPRAMAAAVLGWSGDQVASRLAGPHGRQDLATEVPVYLTYFTAWPANGTEVTYYNDVYDRDGHLSAALTKIERLRTPSS